MGRGWGLLDTGHWEHYTGCYRREVATPDFQKTKVTKKKKSLAWKIGKAGEERESIRFCSELLIGEERRLPLLLGEGCDCPGG